MLSKKKTDINVPVKARFRYGGKEVEAEVINPGAHFGMTWMVYVDDCHDPDFYVVEAPTHTEAEEIFVDSPHGESRRIDFSGPEKDDYCPETCHYTGSGTPYDGEAIMVNGTEGADLPWECVYVAPGLPEGGIKPAALRQYELDECASCGKECYVCTGSDDHSSCSTECKEELDKLFRW